jgi:hypothetical protein
MSRRRCFEIAALLSGLLIAGIGAAQTQIPATNLCNTGLTPASAPLAGCATSTPVTPINPQSGGASVDGNWQLATPYPSATSTEQAPNPCSLTFGPAWVDTPSEYWLNPDDGLSQWSTPLSDDPNTAPGWYIYRTAFSVPPMRSTDRYYELTVSGQVLADDWVAGIFLEAPAGGQLGCRLMTVPAPAGSGAWAQFTFAANVPPNPWAALYFLVYNQYFGGGNATGLRVEFTSAYFTRR